MIAFKNIRVSFFRLLSILTLGSLYLPVVFKNLPFPFRTISFYLVIWFIMSFIDNPRIYSSKLLRGVYLYLVIMSFGVFSFWSEIEVGLGDLIDLKYIIIFISWVALPLLMLQYFFNSKDLYGLSLSVKLSLVFIIITSVTSIIGLSVYPDASRLMAGSLKLESEVSLMYEQMGVGSYGFFASVAFILPTLAYYIRTNGMILNKFVYLFLILLIIVAMVSSQHTIIMLTGSVFFIFAYLNPKKRLLSIVLLILLLGVFFITPSFYADILYSISDSSLLSERVSSRFADLGKTIEFSDYNPDSGKTYASTERLSRSLFSLESFLSNPFIGGGKSGGHAFWLDQLALFGLLGFIPWIIIFKNHYRFVKKNVSFHFFKFIQLSYIAVFLFGLFKNMGGAETWMAVFFIAPSIFFIKSYSKVNQVVYSKK